MKVGKIGLVLGGAASPLPLLLIIYFSCLGCGLFYLFVFSGQIILCLMFI